MKLKLDENGLILADMSARLEGKTILRTMHIKERIHFLKSIINNLKLTLIIFVRIIKIAWFVNGAGTGIEPRTPAWKVGVLPLNYARNTAFNKSESFQIVKVISNHSQSISNAHRLPGERGQTQRGKGMSPWMGQI